MNGSADDVAANNIATSNFNGCVRLHNIDWIGFDPTRGGQKSHGVSNANGDFMTVRQHHRT